MQSSTGSAMNYCSQCGGTVTLRIPPCDTLPRHVCDRCGEIHYQNPRLVVGTLPVWEDKVLLCRRAINPRHGMWTLPAGFMENGETVAQAALRETWEEALAHVEVEDIFALISVPHINQVHVIYRARLLDLNFAPGAETLEVALFEERKVPWGDIAFQSISLTLRHFFSDRRHGFFVLHTDDLMSSPPCGQVS
jgi:ADP-ribose pyrophosphatase YjhB (NUDIX family)